MLFRANCLAKGNSGVRMELIERLLTLLNHDILPLIPERGSCGASGDLVPLSYVGRALVGETEVLYEGAVREARGRPRANWGSSRWCSRPRKGSPSPTARRS